MHAKEQKKEPYFVRFVKKEVTSFTRESLLTFGLHHNYDDDDRYIVVVVAIL